MPYFSGKDYPEHRSIAVFGIDDEIVAYHRSATNSAMTTLLKRKFRYADSLARRR